MPASPAPILDRPRPLRRRGFTLAEMLVVIGIILLVLAIALPAFTAIIGSRSKEAAQNIVAASLVRARSEAIRRGTPCGVFFFVDPDTKQSALAICQLGTLSDPDAYDEYHAYARGPAYQGGTYNPLNEFNGYPDTQGEPPMTADRVTVLTADGNAADGPDNPLTPAIENTYGPKYATFNGRPLVMSLEHSSLDTNPATPQNDNVGLSNPGDNANEPGPNLGAGSFVYSPNPRSAGTAFWNSTAVKTGELELIDGLDVVRLPAGVGVQVIRQQVLDGDNGLDGAQFTDDAGNIVFRERYVRVGLIAFSPEGQLVQTPWRVEASTRLGGLLRLGDVPASFYDLRDALDNSLLQSEIGVVIYDQDQFKDAAADGTATQWRGDAVTTLAMPVVIENFKTTEGDFVFPLPLGDRPQDLGGTAAQQQANEYAEERWLDQNTIPLMVNRYSGILVEAQAQ